MTTDAPPDPEMWQSVTDEETRVWNPDRQRWQYADVPVHGHETPVTLMQMWHDHIAALGAPPTLEQRLRREIARREELLWLAYNHGPDAQREQEQALRVLKGLLREHEAAQ